MAVGAVLGIAAAVVAIVVLVIALILWRHKAKNSTEASAEDMPREVNSGSSISFCELGFLTESNPASTLWDEGQFPDMDDPGNFVE
jgi:hypothetical protein